MIMEKPLVFLYIAIVNKSYGALLSVHRPRTISMTKNPSVDDANHVTLNVHLSFFHERLAIAIQTLT